MVSDPQEHMQRIRNHDKEGEYNRSYKQIHDIPPYVSFSSHAIYNNNKSVLMGLPFIDLLYMAEYEEKRETRIERYRNSVSVSHQTLCKFQADCDQVRCLWWHTAKKITLKWWKNQ